MLVGLGVGADDYLTKPFSMREVVARVAPCCAASSGPPSWRPSGPPPSSVGDLADRPRPRRTTVAGDEVHLTPDRVRPAAVPGPGARAGAHPRAAAARGLGLGTLGQRQRDPHRRQPRQGAAQQGGGDADPHRARRRLRPRGPRMSAAGSTPSPASRSSSACWWSRRSSPRSLLIPAGLRRRRLALLVLPVSVALALGVTQLLAAGMVAPLRRDDRGVASDGARRLHRSCAHVRPTRSVSSPPPSTGWPRTSRGWTASGAT